MLFENHLKRTSTFVPGKQARKQAHAICKSIKCSSAAHVEKLRNIKGSVSPQLQFGRSLFVSSCNYLPRWRIWLVESFGIYRPESTGHKLFELRHVFTFNSEIRICVAPSIEISLNSNTQRVETERFYFAPGNQAHAICKSIKCSSAAHVEKLRNIEGSVSPQLQSGRSLFVSSCNYLPRWSIRPAESFGIYRPESTIHKLLSCAMYSLQIPKSWFGLHHP